MSTPDYDVQLKEWVPKFLAAYQKRWHHDPGPIDAAFWAFRVNSGTGWTPEDTLAEIQTGYHISNQTKNQPPVPDWETFQVEVPTYARQDIGGVYSAVLMRCEGWSLDNAQRWMRDEPRIGGPDTGGGVPGVPDGPSAPPEGVVRGDGRWWMDDGGTWFPLGGSALYGMCDGRDPRPLFDQYAEMGLDFVRVFCGALTGRGQTPDQAFERLPNYVREASQRGLRTLAVVNTDTGAFPYDVRAHTQRIASLASDSAFKPWMFFEDANEFWHPTQSSQVHDRNFLMSLRGLYPSDAMVALGAAEIDEFDTNTQEYPGRGGDFNTAHLKRDFSPGGVPMPWYHEACRTKELFEIMRKYNVPGMSGEPNKLKGPAFYRLMGVISRGFGNGLCVHTQQGLNAERLSGFDLSQVQAAVQGHRLIRGRDRMEFHQSRHDAVVLEAEFEERGNRVWRIYSYLGGGQDMAVFAGVRGGTWEDSGVEFKGSWHVTDTVDEWSEGDRKTIVCSISQ